MEVDIKQILSFGPGMDTRHCSSLLEERYIQMIFPLVHSIEIKDQYTYHHSLQVGQYSRRIAMEMGLGGQICDSIYYAGLLHDLGKIKTPDSILNKAGKLTAEEFKVIQKHPMEGYLMISEIFPLKERDIDKTILYHHERMDGSGYPYGLKGEKIPLSARIIAVADVFDAITTLRSYKPKESYHYAVQHLKKCKGSQFDDDVVDAFLRVLVRDKQIAPLT